MPARESALPPTKLEQYLLSHDIKPAQIAKHSGYSRQHLLRVRRGLMEPTRPVIKAITRACRDITGEALKAADLFDLDE